MNRLSTANTALAANLARQSRLLASLASAIFAPFALPLPAHVIDEVGPQLTGLLACLPYPTDDSCAELHALSASTADLLLTLSHLVDSLHEARQLSQGAGRRLRGARELVAELRRERDAADAAARWLERHGWADRLRARQCAQLCGDVVGGFEELCQGWRDRILRQGSVAG